MKTIWDDVAAIIDALPAEEQERMRTAMREWTHGLRGSLGVVFSSVGVLERRYKTDNAGLFEAARNGMRDTLVLLDELKRSYDKE